MLTDAPRAVALAIYTLLALTPAGCRDDADTRSPFPPQTSSSSGGGGGGAGGSDEGPPPPPESLTILNWNVENLFNDTRDTSDPDEIVVSATAYREKRAAIAAVLRALDPDVIVLQEVERLSVLEDLKTLDLEDAYPHAALVEGNDARGIDIGALSKVPFDAVVSHKDERFTRSGTQGPIYVYTRDCLELHLTHAGRNVVLLGVHFRSKASPDDPDRRLAEAQHTRAIADALAADDPTAAIAILGDFNDVTGSAPYRAIAGSGDTAFDDVVSRAPEGDRWTYNFNGSLELIDHQMASPILVDMLDAASVRVPHDPMFREASDHAPIVATYNVVAPP